MAYLVFKLALGLTRLGMDAIMGEDNAPARPSTQVLPSLTSKLGET